MIIGAVNIIGERTRFTPVVEEGKVRLSVKASFIAFGLVEPREFGGEKRKGRQNEG